MASLKVALSALALAAVAAASPSVARKTALASRASSTFQQEPGEPQDGWAAPYPLSTSPLNEVTGYGFQHPIATDPLGSVHVAWRDSESSNLHYRKWTRATGVWSPAVTLPGGGQPVSAPSVACDTDGNVHLFWSTGSPEGVHYRKFDAVVGQWRPETLLLQGLAADPSAACRPNGLDIHVVCAGMVVGRPLLCVRYIKWSPSTGWTASYPISPDTTAPAYTPSVAVDSSGSAYVTWRQVPYQSGYNRVILRTRISDVWQPIELVEPVGSDQQTEPCVAVTPGGDAHIAWHSLWTDRVLYRAKISGTWSGVDTVSPTWHIASWPAVAVQGDVPHVLWQATYYTPSYRQEIDHRRRVAGVWGPLDRLTFTPINRARSPGIAADRLGFVHGLWYEYSPLGTSGDPWYARFDPDSSVDVGVRAVMAPVQTVALRLAAARPQALVKNLGLTAQADVPVVCSIFGRGNTVRFADSITLSSINPGDTARATFGLWTFTGTETCRVRMSTRLAGDQNPANDAAERQAVIVPAAHVGGPNEDGMTWIDSDTARGPVYRWRDISTTGTAVSFPSYDDDGVRIPIGFTFAWPTSRADTWDSVYVNTNGIISLDQEIVEWDNVPLPYEYGIFALWDDLDCIDSGRVKYQTVGAAPNETLIVSWDGVSYFNRGDSSLSFQVLLLSGSNEAVIQYRDVSTGCVNDNGFSATVGIQQEDVLQYLYGDEQVATPHGNLLAAGLAIRYCRWPVPVEGWWSRAPMPLEPSSRDVKDGGWLAYDHTTHLVYAAKGYKTADFYSYDVISDSWRTRAPVPAGGKPPSKGAAACDDWTGRIYATKGNNTVEFYCYDAHRDSWNRLADVPLGENNKKVKGGTDLAYFNGSIYLLKGYKNEFWKYNAVLDSWTSLPSAPLGTSGKARYSGGSWLVYDGDHSFYCFKAKYNELFEFDASADTWLRQLACMPMVGRSGKSKKAKDGGSAAMFGSYLYALKGGNTQEFWCYWPSGNQWFESETIPAVGSSGKKKRVKGGGDLVAVSWPVRMLYALKGSKCREFWCCAPSAGFDVGRTTAGGVVATAAVLPQPGIMVAPNPARAGTATLKLRVPDNGPVRLDVVDAAGRIVLCRNLAAGPKAGVTVDLRALRSGTYLLRFKSAGCSSTRKLVVQR